MTGPDLSVDEPRSGKGSAPTATAELPADPPVSPPVPLPEPQPKKPHTARWVGLTVLVVAAGLVAVLATRPPATVAEVQSPLVGKLAPPIRGVTVDGRAVQLPRHPGTYVVLNFFAGWCEPCQEEGPNLVQFAFEQQKLAGGARLIGVVFDDSTSDARTYQETLGATWPTIADPSGSLALSYGVRAPPSTFLIAPDGRVVAYVIAPVTAADLDNLIARAKASGA